MDKTKLEAGTMKWQAGPGTLFCRKITYEPNKTSIIMPGAKTKENVYEVLSVGPDVRGYKIGDLIAAMKGADCQTGSFVKVIDVLGRLVPNEAPDSAVLPPEVNGEALARDMAVAD
jgi:hypothetical protein